MAIKNILVAKNYEITDHSKWDSNRRKEIDLRENYTEMQHLMTASAEQYLQDLDDIVIHTGTADNIRSVFRIHFEEIYQLWQTGVNILYVDLDVLFVKPFEIFGVVDYFSMFNYTSPKKVIDPFYNVKLDHYFNCGIRYYPADMCQQCWQVGLDMVENWNPNRWDTEQIIYNRMLWSQDISLEHTLKPHWAYQYIYDKEPLNNRFNNIPLSDARAIHFHGTRSSRKRLDKMKAYRNESNTSQV